MDKRQRRILANWRRRGGATSTILTRMITAIVLALLPVVIVVGIATHELRLWRRQLLNIRALPEASSPEVGNEFAI